MDGTAGMVSKLELIAVSRLGSPLRHEGVGGAELNNGTGNVFKNDIIDVGVDLYPLLQGSRGRRECG